MMPRPPAKKNQGWSFSAKIHLKVIDILEWNSRKSPNISLYFYGGPYKRFHLLLSSEKNQVTQYMGLKFDFFFNLFGWRYSKVKNLQYFVPFSSQELYLEVRLGTNWGNYLSIGRLGYNSKNIKVVVKNFQCRGRQNLSKGACQKSCESNQNWGSYGQKETTYFKEAFLQVPPLK